MGIFSRKKKRELYRLTGERTRMLTERSSFSFANLTRYIAYTASAGCWGETFAHNKHVVHSSIFLLHVLIDHLTSKRVWRWRGWSRHQPVHVITSINSSYFSDEDSKENTLARLVKCKINRKFRNVSVGTFSTTVRACFCQLRRHVSLSPSSKWMLEKK